MQWSLRAVTPTKLVLAPFAPADAMAVLSWLTSEEEADAWAAVGGRRRGPELFARWHADPDVWPYSAHADGLLCAYGEVWYDREEGEAELARVLVDPAYRGRGIGKQLVTSLAAEARRAGFGEIWLRVLPSNEAAIACYTSAGFVRASASSESTFNAAQPREYIWMSWPRGGRP
jgi:ribosomal protein S18 acetylase RimI-like enzyme